MLRRISWYLSQALRRALQLGVLAFVVYTALGGPWRNYKVAHNNARLVGLIEGDTWAWLYDLNERLLELWGKPLEASMDFIGLPWASRLFGVPMADPVLAVSHVVVNRSLEPALLLALVVPIGLLLVLGKVYCSHLCPMRLVFEIGQLVRGGLLRLGIELPHLRSEMRLGGWVLFGGLLAALGTGSVVWLFVLPYVGVTAALYLGITAGTTGGLLVVPVVLLTADVLLAPGAFCKNLCPQGFVLDQLNRFSLWKLRKVGDQPCPSSCNACELVCPYALSPRKETHVMSCDNCGTCSAACPQKKLVRRLALPVITLLLLLVPATALAHHNKGLPHYGYYENYPQVPTEESVVIQGRWEMGGTIFNFQGYDRKSAEAPNDVKFFVYLYDLTTDGNYVGPVDFEIKLDGKTVSRFSREGVDEEMIYTTRETLPESGDYELVAHVRDPERKASVSLPFSIDLGDGQVNWLLVAGLSGPVLLLFGLALLGRTRKARAKRMKAQSAAAGAGLFTLLASGLARAAEELPPCHDDPGGTMKHYATDDGGMVMVMGGIPPWMFGVGIGLVIVVSFIVIERLGARPESSFRLNLIKNKKVYRIFKNRWFQVVPQAIALWAFGYIIFAGLLGSSVRNITPVAVWTIWWGGLVFAVVALGPAFCFTCPWDGLANLVSRLRAAARVEGLSFNLKVPGWMRNMWPAIILFALLSWAELGLGATTDPRGTAYMGLAMAALAIAGALLFEKKAFCHYVCPVGRIQGIYANFSPVELRARNPKVCQKCETEDCLHGNEKGYPCPTRISLKVVNDSSYCIGCTECIKSCNKHNVALNLRPPGSDLHRVKNPRVDEAWLCLSLLALTLFHGFSMTTVWENFAPGETSMLKWMRVSWGTPAWVNFSVGMALATAVPVTLYWLSCKLAAFWTRGSGVSAKSLFLQYSFALLPVALFYHLAHNTMHVFMEGGHIVPLLSDPLGAGTNYFGTADMSLGHLLGETPLAYIQVGMILMGHVFGVVVAHKISRRLYSDAKQATRSLVPMTAMMVLVSVAGLSLMVLDMNMRAGRM